MLHEKIIDFRQARLSRPIPPEVVRIREKGKTAVAVMPLSRSRNNQGWRVVLLESDGEQWTILKPMSDVLWSYLDACMELRLICINTGVGRADL